MRKVFNHLGILSALFLIVGAGSIMRGQESYTGPVTEIAIRSVNEGQDLASFAEARDTFVALLTAEPGVTTDREFVAILDGSALVPPEGPVFTGMTHYENLEAFQAASGQLANGAEARAFFSTFTPQVFTALRPKNLADTYDLATIASEAGQVLQVVVRDLSKYENFDADDYETKLNSFLGSLSQQSGVVAEYQWVSVFDPNIVVGMTVYESLEALQTLAENEEILAIMRPFAQKYPSMTSYIHTDARSQ